MTHSILHPLSSILAFSWHWGLDGWIVAAGILCAMSCALLGNFLVLRRMSMMGDAISHAVLPGLAIAFLVTNSRESLPMFIGAAIVGVLTALFTQWINRFGRVEESASMGVVFTSLFAIGLILIVRAADHVDLDPGCVLYGAIEMVPLDIRNVFGFEIPRAVVTRTQRANSGHDRVSGNELSAVWTLVGYLIVDPSIERAAVVAISALEPQPKFVQFRIGVCDRRGWAQMEKIGSAGAPGPLPRVENMEATTRPVGWAVAVGQKLLVAVWVVAPGKTNQLSVTQVN